jgi:phosphoserine phosphatase RsbU/P
MVRAALEEVGLDELVDTAVLLASELCDNAVLHGGTEFEVAIAVKQDETTITVTDQGPGPLELHMARPRIGRAATHGRGLMLIERLATAWGTRHDTGGHHRTWFTLRVGEPDAPAEPTHRQPPGPLLEQPPEWPTAQTVRWLLHVPTTLTARLDLPVLVTELLRRLCEVVDADGADVSVDYGDGSPLQELACYGRPSEPPRPLEPHELSGPPEPRELPGEVRPVIGVRLALRGPLRGTLRLTPRVKSRTTVELAELAAQRIALAVESEWLHGADHRRKAWMTYLAETSELLAQSLDIELTVAVVPQLVVPRLGRWCAVHLVDEQGSLRLAALTHADEDAIPVLRTRLDTNRADQVREQLAGVLRRPGGSVGISAPSDGVAVALTARGQPLGALTVGRLSNRPHSPEEVALISDLARRASLAIDNARTTAMHIQTSQALQQALLPRQLPVAHGIEFAAEYLPVSTGSDVGGDFYDVLALGSGRWLTSVGDVCGKGARAAARTGLVRDVLRVLVSDGRSPQRAIELLNDVMMEAGDPQQFCTLATALISYSTNDDGPGLGVELVLAGHEQPLLVRADGSVELIGEHGTAVGLVRDVTPTCTRHRLWPGDALVTYTDGVTERRRGLELFGRDRLVQTVAAAAGGSATTLVAAVRSAVETFSADPRRDDIAVLVVRAAPR